MIIDEYHGHGMYGQFMGVFKVINDFGRPILKADRILDPRI